MVGIYNGSIPEYVPYTPIIETPLTRGAYNYSDMNRVEMTVQEIDEALGLGLTTKTDWKPEDVPTKSEWERYVGNVSAISKACFGKPFGYVTEAFNWTQANLIEKTLRDAYIKVLGED
jgi:hypothetical protein